MGGGSWVVQEGFLLCKRDDPASPRSGGTKPPNWKPTISSKTLKELYVVLTMNRKLEFFDGSDIETRSKVDSAYLQGFGGWDGDGLLKVDSYGLELKVERNAKSRMHLAAFNRVDLEKWCRGFMAVLDPQSAAGEEVRRERHRVKKEEKRLQQEREEQIRKWKEKKARMIKEEQDRLLAREEEINNMTPLERIDDIGSLDDDTARMLEKRKQRLQRRHAPTMGRVNKAAYRRRLEEAAGGKTENVQPLHTKVVEQKTKVRVELPPPGQYRKAKKSANRSNGSSSPPAPEPSMANAFAASLAAIRRNRADTVEEMSVASSALSPVAANGKVRNRKRDSQLSAEGKEILKKAMAQGVSSKPTTKSNSGRRGLFDDSSSDEDEGSDTGLFGVGGRKSKAVNGNSRASASMRSSDLSVNARPTPMKKKVPAPSVSSEEVSSDSDSDNGRKSVGVFTFTLQFGNLEHTFSFTYAEFEEVHTRLMSAFPGITLPKFPSKHRLRSNTKPENMEKRGQEFRLYLQQLVALPGVLSSERFQFEYHIDGAFARALANGQKPNESASNGAQSDGRPPRSPVAPHPRKEETVSSASSRSDSPPPRAAKVKASKGLFGLDSDLESDSDTSVDTPEPLTRQRGESAASSTQRRKPRTSDFSSSVISSVAEDTQRGKKSRSRSRLSSRASSRASFAPPPPPSAPPKPAVTGLPPGRPNPFGGGRGDLLAAIRQGTQLKKSDDFNDSAGGNSGGASTAATPPPPPVTQPGSINEAITNAMAMRRIHVEYEETKSNADSDSDDDWD
ncbi:hypothetical protein PInf_002909 [Phytophthora infestans]|nr:hypothetical protein PInf_002909 [Phytophthora infestans]